MNFQLKPIEGERSAVFAAVHATAELSSDARAFIGSLVESLPQNFNGAKVLGSIHKVDGLINVHITVTGKTLSV